MLACKETVCLMFLCILWPGSQSDSTLKLAHVLFRHGDRTPIHMIPGDVNNTESTWPEGLGQLTPLGVQQEYQLGQYLRTRYDGFLSRTYHSDEIYVRSTNVDRALQSAYSALAGLYPPEGTQKWDPSIPWYPIPVHTLEEDRAMLFNGLQNCNAFNKLYNKTYNSQYVHQMSAKYKNILQMLSNKTNQNITVTDQRGIGDTLFIEKLKNRTLPAWYTEDLLHTLRHDLYPIYYNLAFCGAEMSKFKGGILLGKMIKEMHMKARGLLSPDSLKMFIYSGHDSNIGALLCSLQSYNNLIIPYSAMLILELHQSDDRSHFVRVFYRNDTNHDPYPLILPGCEEECPLEKFMNITKDYVTADRERLCQDTTWSQFANLIPVVSISVACGVCFLILVIVATQCCATRCGQRRSLRPRTYGKLRVEARPEEVPMINSAGGSDLDD